LRETLGTGLEYLNYLGHCSFSFHGASPLGLISWRTSNTLFEEKRFFYAYKISHSFIYTTVGMTVFPCSSNFLDAGLINLVVLLHAVLQFPTIGVIESRAVGPLLIWLLSVSLGYF
jgi:hypothetical protein